VSPLGKAPALSENIRLRWKWLTVTNNLAYYDTDLITTVKCFIVKTTIEIAAGFIVLLKTCAFKGLR
jgi:hypothetical protein